MGLGLASFACWALTQPHLEAQAKAHQLQRRLSRHWWALHSSVASRVGQAETRKVLQRIEATILKFEATLRTARVRSVCVELHPFEAAGGPGQQMTLGEV